MVDNQTFFDATIRHLVSQGKQAMMKGSIPFCAYRLNVDATMLKCAAGVHIPDNLYSPDMEGGSINKVLCEHPELEPFFPIIVKELLDSDNLPTKLQHLHDSISNWAPHHGRFIAFDEARDIARLFEVNTRVVDELEAASVNLPTSEEQ